MSVPISDLKRELELQQMLDVLDAKESLLHFTHFTKKNYDSKEFHKQICEKLDKFERGDIKKLMIFVPPQHGKSELSSRRFPAYALGKNPDRKIALCSYGADHAQSFNRDVQRIIDDEVYLKIFPNTTLNQSNVATDSRGSYKRTSNIFQTVGYEGFLKTVGVGGALTGTTVDIGIIDDPFKDREEANSQRIRDKVWNWYTDVFESRLHNDSQQLLLFTRWHEDDLGGRILDRDGRIQEGGEWDVVTFRALKESGDDDINFDIKDNREYGEALWEDKHSRKKLEKIKNNSPRTFISLYQQRPAPLDGNILKRESFNVVYPKDLSPQFYNMTTTSVADLSYTDKEENDPNGLLAYKVYKNDLYVIDYVEYREQYEANQSRIKQFVDKHSNCKIYIENKASGLSMVNSLKVNHGINAVEFKVGAKDKMARLMSVLDFFEAGRVKIVKNGQFNFNVDLFIENCMMFPAAKHDERIDCLVMAIRKGLNRKTLIDFADY